MIERELGRVCQFHEYKEPKSLRECVNNTAEVVKIVKNRIDDIENNRLPVPEVIQKKVVYPTINGKDIRHYLINHKERLRCSMILRTTKKNISPHYLLYRCIRKGNIRYKGEPLRNYFSSNEQYLLAASRIKHGWSVERAIAERNVKYSFHDNGMKGSEALRIKLGLKTRGQAMRWLAYRGMA